MLKKCIRYSERIGKIISILIWLCFWCPAWGLQPFCILRTLGLFFLSCAAVQDLYECRVHLFAWTSFLLLEVGSFFMNEERMSFTEIMTIIGFGLSLLVFYFILKKHIGFADIMVSLALSFGFGLSYTILIMLVSCVFILIVGTVMAFTKRIKFSDGLPMIPFMYLSLFLLQVSGYIG